MSYKQYRHIKEFQLPALATILLQDTQSYVADYFRHMGWTESTVNLGRSKTMRWPVFVNHCSHPERIAQLICTEFSAHHHKEHRHFIGNVKLTIASDHHSDARLHTITAIWRYA